MAINYDSGRWSAVQHLKMAAETEVGSELESRHIAMARVCASVTVATCYSHSGSCSAGLPAPHKQSGSSVTLQQSEQDQIRCPFESQPRHPGRCLALWPTGHVSLGAEIVEVAELSFLFG
jgi:hypothetical protein